MNRRETKLSGNEVLDPRGIAAPLAGELLQKAREVRWPTSLRGSRIAFLSNGKPNVATLLKGFAMHLAGLGASLGRHETKPGPLGPASRDVLERVRLKADAIVVGVSDGGTATSWGVHDALDCASHGVPTVLVCTSAFHGLASRLLPPCVGGVRCLEIPHPLSSLDTATTDEVAARSAPRLCDLLLAVSSKEARSDAAEFGDPGEPEVLPLHTNDAIEASNALYKLGMTDGLPVGVPTRIRIESMLSAWDHGRLGSPVSVPPRHGLATARALAVNAVLAGLPPPLLPYLAAVVKAACRPEFNLLGLQTTTNPATPVVVVGGPSRETHGFNHGLGALGPGNMANATLGRALRLCMQNLGGVRAGDGSDPATMGQPGKYTFCFAANEDLCSWDPLRVQTDPGADMRACDSVTLLAGTGTLNMIIKSTSGIELLKMVADSIRISGSNDYMFGGHPLLILCPEHATILEHDGLGLDAIREYLYLHARIPFSAFLPKNQEMMLAPRAGEFESLGPDTLIPIVTRPSDMLICVAGGPSMHSTFVPSFGGSQPVSLKVEVS